MSCNLNFNQCFSGPYYPTPIYDCTLRLLNLLTPSTTTIANPTVSNFAFYNTLTSQVVAPGASVALNFVSGFGGMADAGLISLGEGNYQVTFNAVGIVPAGGTIALGIALDGGIVLGAIGSMTGTVGSQQNITDSTIINIDSSGGVLSLINPLAESETISSASLVITRLGQ